MIQYKEETIKENKTIQYEEETNEHYLILENGKIIRLQTKKEHVSLYCTETKKECCVDLCVGWQLLPVTRIDEDNPVRDGALGYCSIIHK